ncbi:hypothetical protein [Nonomuraea sp. NPDC023979]|uniref:hypothetical protein n=1 Tax=Nonomuraea sp. NPDC023979 TaxID=3154796 RepID=UPI0033C19F57
MGEPLFVGPHGRPLVILGERVLTLADAKARYIQLRAQIRRDDLRGGSEPRHRQAVRQLGEALAHHYGCTPYDIQIRFRLEVAKACQALMAT